MPQQRGEALQLIVAEQGLEGLSLLQQVDRQEFRGRRGDWHGRARFQLLPAVDKPGRELGRKPGHGDVAVPLVEAALHVRLAVRRLNVGVLLNLRTHPGVPQVAADAHHVVVALLGQGGQLAAGHGAHGGADDVLHGVFRAV